MNLHGGVGKSGNLFEGKAAFLQGAHHSTPTLGAKIEGKEAVMIHHENLAHYGLSLQTKSRQSRGNIAAPEGPKVISHG